MIGTFSLAGYFIGEAQPGQTALSGAPRARAMINLFMNGGPSQMDTFDYKPRLKRDDGKSLPFTPPRVANPVANNSIFASPYRFARHGQSGLWVSELFPALARRVDDLTVIHSMHHTQEEHGMATCFTCTGYERAGRPTLGAWVLYALGSRNPELPGYVALNDGNPQDDYLTSGFLPPAYLATRLHSRARPLADVQRREASAESQQGKLDFIRRMNRLEEARGENPLAGAADACREQAIAMQRSIPDLYDFSTETSATLALYGIPEPATRELGTQCLVARRLIERGVRFVQVTHSNWDHHQNLRVFISQKALEADRPIAALLQDLKMRGLLDDTLVLWGGEFGRTPHGVGGREHNPFGYTVFLAGGGVKGGYVHGATDEFSYFAVENKVEVHDLHATILHLLGIDHKRLTYRFGGRDFRLTDVAGNIVHELID